MALIRNNFFWDMFSRVFGVGWFYGGEICLSAGDYEITIKTKHAVKKVWISMDTPEHSVPVCCGDVSMVGSRIEGDHVHLDAKIRSEVVTLNYFFEF